MDRVEIIASIFVSIDRRSTFFEFELRAVITSSLWPLNLSKSIRFSSRFSRTSLAIVATEPVMSTSTIFSFWHLEVTFNITELLGDVNAVGDGVVVVDGVVLVVLVVVVGTFK